MVLASRKRSKAASVSQESIAAAHPSKKRTRTTKDVGANDTRTTAAAAAAAAATASTEDVGSVSSAAAATAAVATVREQRCLAAAAGGGACWVLAAGEGDAGQLGLGPDVMECQRFRPLTPDGAPVVEVAAGGMHSVYLTADGKVFTFGCNDESALGYRCDDDDSNSRASQVTGPLSELRVVQVAAGSCFSAALTSCGQVFMWGTFRDSNGAIGLLRPGVTETEPRQLQLPCPVKQLAAGGNHVAVLAADGHVYTAGNAEQGQLGRVPEMFAHQGGRRGLEYLLTPRRVFLGGRSRRLLFDRVWAGTFCTVVRSTTASSAASSSSAGQLFVFGLNNYHQLALDTTSSLIAWTPTLAKSFSDIQVEQFVGSMHHSIVRDSRGRVYTLGRHDDGRLGVAGLTDDLTTPTLVPALTNTPCISVSASGYVSMAASDDGDVYTWGMGTTGQLGLGDDQDRHEPAKAQSKGLKERKVLMVSAGGTHNLVLASSH